MLPLPVIVTHEGFGFKHLRKMYSKIPGINILNSPGHPTGWTIRNFLRSTGATRASGYLGFAWFHKSQLMPLAAWMFKGPRTTWENIIFSKRVWQPHSQTLMEKIPFWGFLRRDVENPVGPGKYDQIWKDER